MEKKIKWIIQYDTEDSKENRLCGLSSLSLCDYKISLLSRNFIHVDIISPAITQNQWCFYSKKDKVINDLVTLKLFSTFGLKGKIGLFLSKLSSIIQLFLFLIFHTKKDEIIIVSHSLIFCIPVYIAKRIKKFRVLLDFGEEYNKVKRGNLLYQYFEPKMIACSDKYIFANDLMASIYNVDIKDFVVIYGQYISHFKRNPPISDNRIHLVYAGIISREENSVYKAIKLAKYLDDKYCIHILGKINEEEESYFFEALKKNTSECQVVYEGVKRGTGFFRALSQYHVGLNLREPSFEYIDYAFPSKCLSYLSAGLHVVSSDILAVKESSIGNLIHFYSGSDLSQIAQTVRSICFNVNYNPSTELKKLDKNAAIDLIKMLHI